MDHVTIAVADLEAAAQRFQDLGFHVREGRLHEDGLQNRFIEFADGTELELMSLQGEPGSTLAEHYAMRIAEGDGAAFLALTGADPDQVLAALKRKGFPAGNLQGRAWTYTVLPNGHRASAIYHIAYADGADMDDPGAHANTATGLTGVWLRGSRCEDLVPMLEAIAAVTPDCESPVAGRIDLGHQALSFLPALAGVPEERAITGVRIAVSDLDALLRILEHEAHSASRILEDDRGRWVIVPADSAHGVWLQFYQPRSAS